jgi:replication factor A1
MRNKASPGEYLAFLSMKYRVDADDFFHALISAGERRSSKCGELSIECRSKQKNKIVLLITRNGRVAAQFPLPRDFLLQENNPLKGVGTMNMPNRLVVRRDGHQASLQIKDLRIGMKQVNLKAEVLEVAKPASVVTRFGGWANVANALVSDDTGTIKLCLWNEQINSVSAGDMIEIENASISTFRGEKQLRIGKKGVLRIAGNTI